MPDSRSVREAEPYVTPIYDHFRDFWDSLTDEELQTATKRGVAFAAWQAGRRSMMADVKASALGGLLPDD